MNFINKKLEATDYIDIDSDTALIYINKAQSFGVLQDSSMSLDNQNHNKHAFFSTFESAIVVAKKKGLLVMSKTFTRKASDQDPIQWVNLIYNPETSLFSLKILVKCRIRLEVSDAHFEICLAEVQSQKRHDREHNFSPINSDYYNIDAWNF